jgi:hypothetical protein
MAKKIELVKPKRLALKDYAFETDYQLAAIAEELDIMNDMIDILWNQTANLELAVYEKKRWWKK